MYLLVDNHLKTLAQAGDGDRSLSAADITAAVDAAFAQLQQRDPAFALARRRVMALLAKGDLAAALREAVVLAGSYAQTQAALDTPASLPPQYLMSFFAEPAD